MVATPSSYSSALVSILSSICTKLEELSQASED